MNWLDNKVIASGQLGFDHNEIIDSEHKRREYNNRAYTECDRKKRELNEQLDGSKQKIQEEIRVIGRRHLGNNKSFKAFTESL